eukprot:4432626-Amphidinium_carterae.1
MDHMPFAVHHQRSLGRSAKPSWTKAPKLVEIRELRIGELKRTPNISQRARNLAPSRDSNWGIPSSQSKA